MDTVLESLIVKLVGDATSYTKMLRSAETATQTAMRNVQAAGAKMTAAITAPLAALGGLGLKAFSDFDSAMAETHAKLDRQTPAIMKQMADVAKALSMSGEVAFSPTELALGYKELASAGLDAAQSMAVLPLVAKFAQAGAFNMETAVSTITAAMSAYGKMSRDPLIFAKNMQHFSDVMVGVENATATSVERVARAMASDAAVGAKQYGMELETLGAILGILAQKGLHAEEAGSTVGRMLRLLTSSFVKNKADWLELGINITDAEGNFLHFADVIEKLSGVLGRFSPEDRIKVLDKLGFETLSQKAILPLIGMSAEIRRQEALYRKTGTTAETAKLQMESFANQMKVLRNQITVVGIEIGKVLAPAVLMLANGLRNVLGFWRGFSDETKRAAVIVAVAAAIIGPVLLALGFAGPLIGAGFGMMLAPLLSVFGLLKLIPGPLLVARLATRGVLAALLMIINPLRLIRFLTASIAAIIAIMMNPKVIMGRMLFTILAVLAALTVRAGNLSALFDSMVKSAKALWIWLEPVGFALEGLAVAVIMELWKGLVAAGEATLKMLGYFLDLANLDWDSIRDGFVEALIAMEWAVRNLEPIAKWAIAGVRLYLANLMEDYRYFFQDYLPALATWAWNNWLSLAHEALTELGRMIKEVGGSLSDSFFDAKFFQAIGENVKEGFRQIVANIVEVLRNIGEIVSGAKTFQGIWKDFVSAPSKTLGELFKPKKVGEKTKTSSEPFVAPERKASEEEARIKEEFDRLGALLKESYAEFRKRRLEEIRLASLLPPVEPDPKAPKPTPPEPEDPWAKEWERLQNQWKKAGQAAGEGYNKGLTSEIQRIDGVLRGSAEARARLVEYQERFLAPDFAAAFQQGILAAVPPEKPWMEPTQWKARRVTGPEAATHEAAARKEMVEILKRMEKLTEEQKRLLEEMAKKPPVAFEGADL